jgi:hypothetical protein
VALPSARDRLLVGQRARLFGDCGVRGAQGAEGGGKDGLAEEAFHGASFLCWRRSYKRSSKRNGFGGGAQ